MQKPIISIAIPTYNRAHFLENLLGRLMSEVEVLDGLVNVCVCDNGSTDDTDRVLKNFKEKYPAFISYRAHQNNLGYDKNFLAVMELADGDFTWLLCDDDMPVVGSIKKVLEALKGCDVTTTGVVMLGHKLSYTDPKTGNEVVYFDTVEKSKPCWYRLELVDIIGIRFSNTFASVLLFNDHFFKEILHREQATIQKATGSHYLHTFLYQLMLFKFPALSIMRLNEPMIRAERQHFTFYVETVFKVFYVARRKLNTLLLEIDYINVDYKKVITGQQKELKKSIIKEIAVAKIFGQLRCLSFLGCIALFFEQAPTFDAMVLSSFLISCYLLPSFFLRQLYKIVIRFKHPKTWQKVWFDIVARHSTLSEGNRQLESFESRNLA